MIDTHCVIQVLVKRPFSYFLSLDLWIWVNTAACFAARRLYVLYHWELPLTSVLLLCQPICRISYCNGDTRRSVSDQRSCTALRGKSGQGQIWTTWGKNRTGKIKRKWLIILYRFVASSDHSHIYLLFIMIFSFLGIYFITKRSPEMSVQDLPHLFSDTL